MEIEDLEVLVEAAQFGFIVVLLKFSVGPNRAVEFGARGGAHQFLFELIGGGDDGDEGIAAGAQRAQQFVAIYGAAFERFDVDGRIVIDRKIEMIIWKRPWLIDAGANDRNEIGKLRFVNARAEDGQCVFAVVHRGDAESLPGKIKGIASGTTADVENMRARRDFTLLQEFAKRHDGLARLRAADARQAFGQSVFVLPNVMLPAHVKPMIREIPPRVNRQLHRNAFIIPHRAGVGEDGAGFGLGVVALGEGGIVQGVEVHEAELFDVGGFGDRGAVFRR